MTAGLVWDNGVIGIGKYIGEGDLLEGLNVTRFWVHALATPRCARVVRSDPQGRKPLGQQAGRRMGSLASHCALIALEVMTETRRLSSSLPWNTERFVMFRPNPGAAAHGHSDPDPSADGRRYRMAKENAAVVYRYGADRRERHSDSDRKFGATNVFERFSSYPCG